MPLAVVLLVDSGKDWATGNIASGASLLVAAGTMVASVPVPVPVPETSESAALVASLALSMAGVASAPA